MTNQINSEAQLQNTTKNKSQIRTSICSLGPLYLDLGEGEYAGVVLLGLFPLLQLRLDDALPLLLLRREGERGKDLNHEKVWVNDDVLTSSCLSVLSRRDSLCLSIYRREKRLPSAR